ncbi:helix-turn-helix transcriptional regulator [uncultured Selenomonas sp.]|uniref:helix-turn-helix domain-containing protein n=1 Tax=uncultured Selenomonas sp. TaxID=159275 RepID=UPI0028EB1C28|nr:helix-turn-helix transcriptional regulator [uncultured Selenomonas sp.]
MTTGERIRHFRKQILKMTQEDFARKINISRSNLGNIEVGTIGLTDRVATDICNAFSVSEVWLRSGEGEIYRESESTLFSAFVRQYDLSEKEQQAARYLLSLSSEDRQQILRVVEGLARAMQDDDAKKAEVEKRDQAHRMLDVELDAEQKGQSASDSGSSAAKMA